MIEETSSLKDKTVKGTFWSAMDNFANLGVSFIVSIILARLLTPSQYGVLAMIQIFIAISNTIVDSGFSSALIRKQNLKAIDYNTTFCFNNILSFILYIILYLLAPFISKFFQEPILINVTRVIGLILIINSIGIIPRTIFVRTINFKVQMKVSLISSLVSGFIGIGLAFLHYGVWSLVWQQLSRQMLNTILLWILSKWKPVLEFSKESFHNLFGFGSKILVSGLLDTIWNNLYYVVIGKFYLSSALGQYTRAQQFSDMLSNNITLIIQRVSYPVLSSIQTDDNRLRDAYRKIVRMTMTVTFACMFGLSCISKTLIMVLIGQRWMLAADYLQLMCFIGMLYPLHAINLNILQVKGRSDLFLKLEVIKKTMWVIPIIVGILFSIKSMLYVSIFVSIISYYINTYYTKTLISYSMCDQIKDIIPSFVISLIVSLLISALVLLNISSVELLFLQIIGLFVFTVLAYKIFKIKEFLEVKKIILSIIKKDQNE